MSLTITKAEDELRQLAMTIEIAEDRVTSEMKKIAKTLAKQVRVPGFRPGKAPFRVILKRFGEEQIRAQAVEDMMQNVIMEALQQEEVLPYARPSVENIDIDKPVKLELLVPLDPSVTLGDYREIRKELEKPEVSEDAVEEAVQAYIDGKIEVEEVDRAAEAGDLVRVAGKGLFDAKEEDEDAADSDDAEKEADENGDEADSLGSDDNVLFDNQDGIEFLLDEAKTFTGTDFVKNLIGASVGDSLSFSIQYPAEYEISDFAGRVANVELDVLEIKSREVPELTDELVKDDDYESVADFKEKTRKNLEEQAFETFRSETLDEWVDELRGGATLVYPPGAIEQELEERLEGFKRQITSYGWSWEDYLNIQNEDDDSIKENWREAATKDVESGLVLRTFISEERLTIEEGELDAMIDDRMSRFDDMDDNVKEAMREVMRGQESAQRMMNELMVEKAFTRIEEILGGTARDLIEIQTEFDAKLAEAEAADEEAADEEDAAVEAEATEDVENVVEDVVEESAEETAESEPSDADNSDEA